MFFKIIFFFTILNLHNIHSHGKLFKIEIPTKHLTDNGTSSELFFDSTAKVNTRLKRDTQESRPSIRGISRAQTLRNYLNIIEKYISAMRRSIDNENNFSRYGPSGQHNGSSEMFDSEFSEKRQDQKLEILKDRGPFNFHLWTENERGDKIISYENDGDNETVFSNFSHVPNVGMTFEPKSDDMIESNVDFSSYENTGYDDFPPDFNPNIVHQDVIDSGQDYLNEDVQNIYNQGICNFCEECRKCFHPYKKHLTTHIKSDCSNRPAEKFINECTQSRAHCRPYKSTFSSHQLPKHHRFY